MKKLIIFIFIAAIFLLVKPVIIHAQWGMMGGFTNDQNDAATSSQTEQQNQQTLNTMVNSLLKSQNVLDVNQLNCSKIPQDQLVKPGDAWMDVEISNQAAHEAMDNMLGGKGSENLDQVYTQMAERYLRCQINGSSNYSWMPMMFGYQDSAAGGGGFPVMGWGYGYGPMANGSFGWGIGVLGFLFWLIIFIDLVLVGVLLLKRIRK